ncbi:acetylglutamate kinase [Fundicoccus sp. Sow4_F4]|uniref:acetylglutamate kinase n=1 Tax=Fundicoccus sp. Sow4_F4 TaxID=3438783 RepID=UPI003F8EEDE1
MKNDNEKAEILIESLEYIKNFHNKVVVIKYGGHAMISPEIREQVISDIVWLKYVGMKPVIVHGGGPEINQLLKVKGIETRFIDGLRVTTPEIMQNIEMVLTGSVSPSLTTLFNANGIPTVSVSGKDNKILEAELKSDELGLVGEITKVNTSYLNHVIEGGFLPVISPIAYGPDGLSLNINSDEAASQIAKALEAEKLILLTDVAGVYRDFNDPSTLISRLDIQGMRSAIEEGIISGGMIPKLECCLVALEGGVQRCHIINGTIKHSLILELFTKQGIGTMITH